MSNYVYITRRTDGCEETIVAVNSKKYNAKVDTRKSIGYGVVVVEVWYTWHGGNEHVRTTPAEIFVEEKK